MMRRCYDDPRFIALALLVILVGGTVGFKTRLTQEDPESLVRWGYVTTKLAGSEPSEVESLVSEPIERILREAGSVHSIESSSLRGVSLVFIRLTDDETNVGKAWTRIQDKLSEVASKLPARASVPVLNYERQWGSHSRVIVLYENEGNEVAPGVLARWAKELDSRLSFVVGTRFTETFGMPNEEILVEIDEKAIAATKLTIDEVSYRIRARDSEGLDATSQTDGLTMPVSLIGDMDELDRLRALVLRGDESGGQLQLGDMATIHRGEYLPRDQSVYFRGRRGVVVAARMDESHSIDNWTERQIAELTAFESLLPAELGIELLFSQKVYTDRRAGSLYANLAMGMVLVVCVVCLMMGWRAAVPICAALPLTLGVVFLLMIPFGISLHQMSIAGLILALGMLIDNPIIVVDDIQRRLDRGVARPDAMQQSIYRMRKPLLGSNLTTILGFTPILLIGGPTGEFMEQLGWSVIACLLGSLLLSLTVIPVLAAWWLRPAPMAQVAASVERGDRSLARDPIRRGYRSLLGHAVRLPLVTCVVSSIVPVLGFLWSSSLKEQFFPSAERDHFHFSVRLPTQASVQETERVALAAREVVMKHPEVAEVTLFVGRSAPKLHYSMVALEDNRANYAQGLIQLNTPRVSLELVQKLQDELDQQILEAQCVVTLIEQGPPTPAPIEFRLYGPSLERLAELGHQARRLLMRVPGVLHTRMSLDAGGPQLGFDVRQSESENAGMLDEVISNQIRDLLDGSIATTMSEEIEEIPIRVRLANSRASDPNRVLSIPLLTSEQTPRLVSLGSVASWSIDQQVFSIHRRNSSRCNIIYTYVRSDQLPIVVENAFKELLKNEGYWLPPGYRADFGGVSAERASAVEELKLYSAIVVVGMLAILVLTLGSFRLAGVILGVGTLSIGLGLLSLWLFDYPIGIVAIVGIAGLMGLAINDSIVVLSECQLGVQHGKPVDACVYDATRHVLTTSVTTVAGVLPLILSGGDFFPPMMIVIAGGIIGATFIALGFTPACFRMLTRPRAQFG
jgi:multidrug efflux pump subunit AcrB